MTVWQPQLGILTALGGAAICFGLLKCFFTAIGWYTRHGADLAVRRQLDQLHDRLDAIPIRQIVRDHAGRFCRRWESTFIAGRGSLRRFAGLSFGINIVAWSAWALVAMAFTGRFDIGIVRFVVTTSVVGLVLDLAFRSFSFELLKHGLSGGPYALTFCIVADVVLLYVALCLNMFLGTVIEIGLFKPEGLVDVQWSQAHKLLLFGPVSLLGVMLRLAPPIAVLQVIGASLQTVAFLMLGVTVAIARLSPDGLQRAMVRVVFNVTTDDKPVFSQLGNGIGAIGALLFLTWRITSLRPGL